MRRRRRAEIDHYGPVPKAWRKAVDQAESQRGLAAAAGAGEGHQPGMTGELLELRKLVGTSEQQRRSRQNATRGGRRRAASLE